MKPKQSSYKWVKTWRVPSSSRPGIMQAVSISMDGTWGCSCHHWTMRRKECAHIRNIKEGAGKQFKDPAAIIELIALRVKVLKDRGKTDIEIENILDKDLE